ncbi:unnamed protein product [Blepharisma stoltei]|uniref:MIR domain-containing protein n=1 Tax=Blepharisma stoltei TaxID=1481888 RepID=A0AAU9IQ58_9CILI|nr:unnamed protein product [Blepharisma stoltei]
MSHGTPPVTYGARLQLRHESTNAILRSDPINYTTGSGQQEVTANRVEDKNSWFIVKGPNYLGDGWRQLKGTQVMNNSIIRLEHIETGKNLHSSPGVPSPSSGQQEVSAYGNNGYGDDNDDWRIETDHDAGTPWITTYRTRLIHVRSECALHSHGGHNNPRGQEVTGYRERDENDIWRVWNYNDINP